MDIESLPALNASLNATAGVLLVWGYALIRGGNRDGHRRCMLGAIAASAVFLASYTIYHLNVGSKPFPGQGTIRLVYFAVLVSHVILAATVLPLALVTAARGLKGQFGAHRRIARWTFPIWLYVSVTGVLIYLMLYQLGF